jgi:hypothetical protein
MRLAATLRAGANPTGADEFLTGTTSTDLGSRPGTRAVSDVRDAQ